MASSLRSSLRLFVARAPSRGSCTLCRLLAEFEAVVHTVNKQAESLSAAWKGYRDNIANEPRLASFSPSKSSGLGENLGLTLNMSHLDPQLCGGRAFKLHTGSFFVNTW